MTSPHILRIIKKWQKHLGLTHWTFGVSTTAPAENHDMEIAMTPIRQHAAIRINRKSYKYSEERIEKLIIHELLHPLFIPIQTEFERCVDSEKDRQYHTNAIETCIDHLANAIYKIH